MTRQNLLKQIVEAHGYDDIIEAVEAEGWHTDSVVPGGCLGCGHQVDDLEPDAHGYECEECGRKSIASVLILLGVI